MSTAEMALLEATPPLPETRPSLRMSYDDYLSWEHEGALTEWVAGEVIIHLPVKEEHQRLASFLDRLIGIWLQLVGGGLLYTAPYPMRATPDGPGREPDLFFVSAENASRVTRRQLEGPADLAIEIVSEESVARDRAEKFYEYQDAEVREYWILDARPRRQRADFYVLDAAGIYQPVPIRPDGTYHSTVLPGFWLRVEWLWAEQPNPVAALREILGSEGLIAALRGGQ